MKTLLNPSTSSRAGSAVCVALLVALAGCAHAPLRHQTAESELISATDLPAGVTGPVAIRTVAPTYPERMICGGIEGSVWVQCWVDATGEPQDVWAFDATMPEFAEAAVEAMRKWSFAPARRDGRALGMWIAVPFRYKPEFPHPSGLSR